MQLKSAEVECSRVSYKATTDSSDYRKLASTLPIQVEFVAHSLQPSTKKTLLSVCDSLLAGLKPQLVEEGMGGTYFCRDIRGNSMAVFKPEDEEPCAPNNPKSLQGNTGDVGIKTGIRSGEQAVREVAAYAMDHFRLARVPVTLLVSLRADGSRQGHMQRGSFQQYVRSDFTAGDIGPSLLSARDVQAVAALDMRLVNKDRHDGNILVRETVNHNDMTTSRRLIPIDHGSCLPDALRVDWFEWTWLSWPQLQRPIVPTIRHALLAIDVAHDADLLRSLGIREQCIHTMEISTSFIQTCLRLSTTITLGDIAELMCRNDPDLPSPLERVISQARWIAATECLSGVSAVPFRTAVVQSVIRLTPSLL